MRLLKPLSTVFFLALAVSVTAGSLYVAVDAAAQQENTDFLPNPDAVAVQAAPPAPLDIQGEVVTPNVVLHDHENLVGLDENGGFSGKLAALSKPNGNLAAAGGMTVRIIRRGSVVASAVTDDDGGFYLSGLTGGIVGLLATSNDGCLIYSIQLVDEANAFASATPVKLKNSIQLDVNSAVVCASDFALAKQLLLDGVPKSAQSTSAVAGESEQSAMLVTNETSMSLDYNQAQLQADGTLVGRANVLDDQTGQRRDIHDMTLHFLRDGVHLAQTEVHRDGQFAISGLAPGIYSLVATGEDGTLAMGLDITGSVAQLPQDSKYKLASVPQGGGLSIYPCSPNCINETNVYQFFDDSTSDDAPPIFDGPLGPPLPGSPMAGGPMGMGGGFSGGGFAGGGGIGGGGGLGGLLGAAAAGAIGWAIGDDDDDDRAASPTR